MYFYVEGEKSSFYSRGWLIFANKMGLLHKSFCINIVKLTICSYNEIYTARIGRCRDGSLSGSPTFKFRRSFLLPFLPHPIGKA